MKIEEIKDKIDFNNIQELIINKETKSYLMDGTNYMYPLSPLDIKLIEEIKDLKIRIIELEKREVK